MSNRHVPIITGIVSFTIGAALIFGVGKWWAWLIGIPFVMLGWASLKMAFTAPDDEIAAMTSFAPLSKEMDERITRRIGGKSSAAIVPNEIHPDDYDLVSLDDIKWLNTLSSDDIESLRLEDKTHILAAWIQFREDGLSDSDAGKKARLSFPAYYLTLEDRAMEGFPLEPCDAKLPYAIKGRFNAAIAAGKVDRQAMRRASSVNAYARQLIESGRF